MFFAQTPNFFEALEADYDYVRRSPRKKSARFTDPTRDWPQAICSCSKKSCLPEDSLTEKFTPRRSSSFGSKRPSLSFEDVSPVNKKQKSAEPEKLTTTIVESTDPDDDGEQETNYSLDINLHQFAPSEVSVRLLEGQNKHTLVVKGKHIHPESDEQDDDDDDFECLEYIRRVNLPDDVLADELRCSLDQNGHLRVEAPLKKVLELSSERTIPVRVVMTSPMMRTTKLDTAKSKQLDYGDEEIVID